MSHGSPFRLSLGCSALALATALAAVPAQAQSFQGSGSVTFGSASIATDTNTTDITVNSPSAVIDWTPSDNAISNGSPIAFQPAGTTATFTGANGNFAVLNRIVPTDTTRPASFDGTVLSQFVSNNAVFRGGEIYFYSPGGIVVGANAVFNIGSLFLTSAAPVVDPNGSFIVNNTVTLGQANSASAVRILPGAQIIAESPANYVAAFAPYVEQNGTINANGRVALVAGEAGTLTYQPGGLLSIQVSIGTDGRNGVGINTTGVTTGAASASPQDPHRVYMVAVPKNDLLTMTIQRGASLGFDIAGAADVQGNTVVLSAGYNVTDSPANGISFTRAGGTGSGSISINDGSSQLIGTGIDFTSSVDARATGDLLVDVFRQTRFASNAYLEAQGNAIVRVNSSTSQGGFQPGGGGIGGGGGNAGNAVVEGFNSNMFPPVDDDFRETPLGFSANFFGNTYANTFVSSNGYVTFREGNSSFTPLGLGEGYQGPPIIAAFLADIDTGGAGDNDITYGTGVFDGRPAFGANYPGVGYFNDRTDKLNNFQILLVDRGDTGAGNFDIVYNYNSIQWESGSIESPTDDGFGGNSAAAGYNAGTGNQANTFFVFPGSQVPGAFLDGGPNSLAGQSNVGLSGRYLFNVRGGDVEAGMTRGLLTVGGNLSINASGSGIQPGSVEAGTARFELAGGNATVAGEAIVAANGFNDLNADGTVSGGTAQVLATGGGSLAVSSNLFVAANGINRAGLAAQGGTAQISLDEASTVTVGATTRIESYGAAGDANGGGNGQGGAGRGGSSRLSASAGSTFTTNEFNIAADGVGGMDVGAGGGLGAGGTAAVQIAGAGSVLTVASANVTGNQQNGQRDLISAEGFGGMTAQAGGTGGAAQGGTLLLSVTEGATAAFGSAPGGPQQRIVARAFAGDASAMDATGGVGTGGTVTVLVDGGTLSGEGLLPSSYGQGGSALSQTNGAINGGDGIGGTRTLTFTNGARFTGSVLGGCPCGLAGDGSATGRGGNASGGIATTLVDNATLALTGIGLPTFVNSEGGAGLTGGTATAGTASVIIRNGSTVTLAGGSGLSAEAYAVSNISGQGATGGNATGGTASMAIENSTISGGGTLRVAAYGLALGDGQNGGAGLGQGGSALFQTSATSTVAAAELQVIADGINGDGSDGTGGSANVALGGTTMSAQTVSISATGSGGTTGLRMGNSSLASGTVAIAGGGASLLDLDASSISAEAFTLAASTMVLPESPPASPGTVTAPSLTLSVGEGGSIRTYASFVTTGDLVFATPEIVLGSLTTDGLVGLSATNGALTVGNINATQARLTATANLQAGVATLGTQQSRGFLEATSANGSVSVGGATAGEVVLSGPVGVSAGAITASNIYAVTGGNLTVSGAWRAQSITGDSSDIAITSNGAMFAQEYIDLFSTSTTQTIVGDAQGGSWVLDNAEFSRLHAPEINIYANNEGSDPVALLIGDLTVRGAQSGESANLTTDDGELSFFITSRDEEDNFVGTAKVVGSLRGTGFTAENTIDFDADVFQLDAVGGIAELLDSNGNISGVLELEANRIWVASPEILSRLEANPTYEGRINDINTPLAVPRPDGVVRAGFVNIEERPPVQVLVQNTGTRALPAGFFSGSDGPFGEDFEGEVIAGAIELAINGQLVVDGQVITGQAVVNQLISEENRIAFSEISTINSCTATGACPGQGDAFASTIASEFALLTDLQLSEEPFAVEDATEEEEKEAEQAARAPIAPPVILIDTRPLNPPLDIVDPVSGSGNPALVNPATPAGSQGDGQ